MSKAKQPVSINGIEFDALISEDAAFEAEVPEYPIETGFVVNDSIILRPVMLDMTLFLTNSPVTWKSRFGGHAGSRVQTVIKKLEDLYFARTLVTVKTTDKTYTDMAITGITFSKSKEAGYAREIPIKFKQIRVTSSKKVSIPASYGKSGATGTNAGAANTTTRKFGAQQRNTRSGRRGSSSILYGISSSAGLL